MRAPALADAATELPWLAPCAASLLALAGSRTPGAVAADLRTAPGVWAAVRGDPGCVLLLVRASPATRAAAGLSFFPALVRDPAVLETALRHLDDPPAGFADWGRPELRPIYQSCLAFARLAQSLAEITGKADPANAWAAGLLAPLGWLAAAAVDPAGTAACLANPELPGNPGQVQQRLWGLEQAGIARRLCRRWQLPRWLAVVPSYLGLASETAQSLGAEPDLFRIVQLAVLLIQERGGGLHLPVGSRAGEAADALGLSAEEQEAAGRQADALVRDNGEALPAWEIAGQYVLLPDLLRLAADNRRLAGSLEMERLEGDVDCLHQALRERAAGEAGRLQAQKLSALAEFAAGAGHEINNPLAVISGQAQYLLGHEAEPARQKALQTIIGQTRRIHQLLSDLMQFARPPRPRKEAVEVTALVREVAVSLQDLAAQRRVRLVYSEFAGDCPAVSPSSPRPLFIEADPQQANTALACLLRNAIEAAPADGWAGVRLETPDPGRVELVIEDNGTGPSLAQCEHLFDPFFSGRAAGRGKGLGLARAWRLAREQGGDVRFDRQPGGPTRFLLSLPRHTPASAPNPEPVVGTNGVSH